MSLAHAMSRKAKSASKDMAREIVDTIFTDIEDEAKKGKSKIIYNATNMANCFPSSWFTYDGKKNKTILGSTWEKSGVEAELKKQGFTVKADHPYDNWDGEGPDPLGFYDEMAEAGLAGPFDWNIRELVIDWSRPTKKDDTLAAQMAQQTANWSIFGAKNKILENILADIEHESSQGNQMVQYDQNSMSRIFPTSWRSSGSSKSRDKISFSLWEKSGIANELKKQGFTVTTDHPYESWDGEGPDPLGFFGEMEAAGLSGTLELNMGKLVIDWSQPRGATKGSAVTLTSASSTRESGSCGSVILFTDGPKCFLPDTALQLQTGEFVSAAGLSRGCVVRAENDESTKVSRIMHHPPQTRDVVELQLLSTRLCVTCGHRFIIQLASSGRMKEREVLAEDLQRGDYVLCMTGPQELLNVRTLSMHTAFIEVSFNPDVPVPAFNLPDDMVLSKGQKSTRQHRRGGMNRRLAEIRTEAEYSD